MVPRSFRSSRIAESGRENVLNAIGSRLEVREPHVTLGRKVEDQFLIWSLIPKYRPCASVFGLNSAWLSGGRSLARMRRRLIHCVCAPSRGSPRPHRSMTFWLDAHLSPRIARWMSEHFKISAKKDADFEERVRRLGPPPQVIWLNCGNTSEARLRTILEANWASVLVLLKKGEPLVEIRDVADE